MHQKYKNSFKHDFGQGQKTSAERRTFIVMILTLVTMAVEIAAGVFTGSMALLADGIHMGGHALALGLAFAGYYLVRRYADDRRFVFGSGKISELVAYTTSILLFITTLFILYESIQRILHPEPILAMQAFIIAFAGLLINLLSAWILSGTDFEKEHAKMHAHMHGHSHDRGAPPAPDSVKESVKETVRRSDESPVDGKRALAEERDHNLQAALVHVLADAATSVAAMIGIVCAWAWEWYLVDPIIAVGASFIIVKWSLGLMKASSDMLLDASTNSEIRDRIKTVLEEQRDTELVDLHVWAVGHNAWTMVAALVHHGDMTPKDYREKLAHIEGLYHPIIEVQFCDHCDDEDDYEGIA